MLGGNAVWKRKCTETGVGVWVGVEGEGQIQPMTATPTPDCMQAYAAFVSRYKQTVVLTSSQVEDDVCRYIV